jgi:hypothetical protein
MVSTLEATTPVVTIEQIEQKILQENPERRNLSRQPDGKSGTFQIELLDIGILNVQFRLINDVLEYTYDLSENTKIFTGEALSKEA